VGPAVSGSGLEKRDNRTQRVPEKNEAQKLPQPAASVQRSQPGQRRAREANAYASCRRSSPIVHLCPLGRASASPAPPLAAMLFMHARRGLHKALLCRTRRAWAGGGSPQQVARSHPVGGASRLARERASTACRTGKYAPPPPPKGRAPNGKTGGAWARAQ
jgi:hypothetical protein